MQDTIRGAELAEAVAVLNARKTLVDDMVVPASQLVVTAGGRLAIREGGTDDMPIFDTEYDMGSIAHAHLADRLEVPLAYWRRMQAHTLLLAENANYWLGRDSRKFLIRALRDAEG